MDSYNEDKSLFEILKEFGIGLGGCVVQWTVICHKYPSVFDTLRSLIG